MNTRERYRKRLFLKAALNYNISIIIRLSFIEAVNESYFDYLSITKKARNGGMR